MAGGPKTGCHLHAAATVGGILANDTRPADFLYDNIVIETNVIHGAMRTGVESCSCWDRRASIRGSRHSRYGCDFISTMPPNLYGPNDNFDPVSSHVLPALLLKAHRAKVEGQQELEIWGTGTPRREFLYVDDLADALVHWLAWRRGCGSTFRSLMVHHES
jgi:GDP-L-fucose synthase